MSRNFMPFGKRSNTFCSLYPRSLTVLLASESRYITTYTTHHPSNYLPSSSGTIIPLVSGRFDLPTQKNASADHAMRAITSQLNHGM